MVFNLRNLYQFVELLRDRGKTILADNVIVPGVFDAYVQGTLASPKPTARCLVSYAWQSDGGDRSLNKLTKTVLTGHG